MVRTVALMLAACAATSASTVLAQGDTTARGVRLGIEFGVGGRRGVAVLPASGGEAGDSIRAILQRDLDYGDRVTVVGMLASDLPPVSGVPNFDLFARMNVDAIVQPTIRPEGGLHIALYDTRQKAVAGVEDFPLAGAPFSAEWRMSVHAAADEIERWITGVRGIASTRIAFSRGGRLWMVDSDGENAAPIGNESGLSPAWHPSGRYLAYSVFAEPGGTVAGLQIGIRDLMTGTSRRLTATRSGTNSTPTFSPDGTTLVYSFGDDQGSDLYAINAFEPSQRRRISVSRGRESTSPTFSPDGRQLAFVSDRIGHPEVYISDADGTNVDQLTTTGFGDQLYRSNPSWSPDGRAVAFQSQIDGVFQIMTIALRGRGVKAHTSFGQNEDPSWAPDGRHLVFTSTRSGVSQLWVLDTESGRMRQLTRGASSRHAAWSPPLTRK